MQDCARGMGACSNRTCQPNPGIEGIGQTTDRCITAIKPCSKTINEMSPSLPPACKPQAFFSICLHTGNDYNRLMYRKHEKERRVAIKVESSISEIISLSHCWLYLSRQNQTSKYKWDITTMNRYHQKVYRMSIILVRLPSLLSSLLRRHR